jgi:adenosylcobinamide-GDP ribazoletransferase
MTQRFCELIGAFMLLTRLPVARLLRHDVAPSRTAWAFPLVGAAIGCLGGLVVHIAAARLPPLVAAGWTLAVLLLLTGGLHEDGLADTADGLGGGGTVERKLAIMRDSRIGSFGALALALSVLLRAGAIAALPADHVVPSVVAAATLARTGMLVPLLCSNPARSDGLGAGMAAAPRVALVVGLMLAALVCWALLPPRTVFAVVLATAAAAVIFTGFIHRQIGGYTGDTLGAVEQVCECVALSVLSAAA